MFPIPTDFDENEELDSLDNVTSKSDDPKNHQSEDTIRGVHSIGFKDLMLRKELSQAIEDAAFEHPSEIQQETIPHAIHGVDILAQAKSGLGKTAVFVLSLLQQLDESNEKTVALVLAHTRELAFQICNEFERFAKYMEWVKIQVLIGGIPEQKHIISLKETTPHIVVGTPGRVYSMTDKNYLDLNNLKHFVVDECDKLLEDLETRKLVQNIFTKTPRNKQTMMFTATLSQEAKRVCKLFLNNPIEVVIDKQEDLVLPGLNQYFVKVIEDKKNKVLAEILDTITCNQIVIFVKTVNRARKLDLVLQSLTFPSIAVHSRLSQKQRISVYKEFKNGNKKILVSTDLAARGVDIDRVNLVINYDMPNDEQFTDTYLHRVGRAGRFGTKGKAISFISSPDDAKTLEEVQKRFKEKIPPFNINI